ncbi:paramyosin-like [Manduca sexta]|uniref:paramyosin-like n=1 Tax=Manduca sexta TaxID=7130 RepID=UPI00188FABBB|nr:paramyosin-like [Manduca sexta]
MGNAFSTATAGGRNAENVTSESETMSNASVSADIEKLEENLQEQLEDEARAKAKEDEMEEFRRQLNIKREQRKEILSRHRAEKEELEKSLQNEKKSKMKLYESNRKLRELLLINNIEIPENLQSSKENSDLTDAVAQISDEFEKMKSHNNKLRRDLADANIALQGAYSDIADLNAQNTESIKQINALKEVVSVSKTMINLREGQLNELKNKLNEIERTLADRETNLLSADLRQEYERQLQNIRTLRGLYEERARLGEVTRQGLVRELDEQKRLYQEEVNKCKGLTTNIEELESQIESLKESIENKKMQISTCQDEANVLKAEMAVVNKLFSQVLLGYKSKQDLDKLVHRLEENHGLLTHMAERENGSEASSALPKLLLELVSQVDECEENKSEEEKPDSTIEQDNTEESVSECHPSKNTTAEEIVENLPKVWKVLMELLSHQNTADVNTSEKVTTCYKSVETKSGPVLVPSVSQTYIRLKDLIVEKLGLIKEVNRMKQLNAHLETRLGEQERRLCLVTTELSKTWHVVSRLRRHHHQLHTHEKILKYELQQKRKLLNELKEELEYCREKWEQAREKNTQSERDWRKLRAEFSSRKTKSDSPSFNNSAESGYSDERLSDESSESNDESEYVAEPHLRCKKKLKKSFETAIDSSADFNLVAEREDPASDMIDVADLPLDAQDGDDNHDPGSDLSRSENQLKSEKICEETEDELCDIANDESCIDESVVEDDCSMDLSSLNTEISTNEGVDASSSTTQISSSDGSIMTVIDPAEILRNIRLQNERLARRDQKLANLEKNSTALLKKTQATAKFSEQLNSTLDHLINRPTTSKQTNNNEKCKSYLKEKNPNSFEDDETESENKTGEAFIEETTQNDVGLVEAYTNAEETSSLGANEAPENISSVNLKSTTSNDGNLQNKMTDIKNILENVKHQNERLAKKDERLQKLEENCSEVVKTITNTLKTGEEINIKLDVLHSNSLTPCDKEGNEQFLDDNNSPSSSHRASEPSTSNDHEARFAARDLRLKRLEEQTKSLVNKVNKTTSKGVKIHYKLEELHNIYGSENSRAGTPSDDTEDKSNECDTNDET